MIACYILFSKNLSKFYTGMTQESIQSRLENIILVFIKILIVPSQMIANYSFLSNVFQFHNPTLIDKHVKKMKSKIYIENLLNYPEMIEKLKQKSD
jgi:putative endonuclease